MFELGWTEILVIVIVLIVVVGPKDLPRMLRTFGKTTAKMRAMAGDFRKQFDEALKEAELDDVKKLTEEARKLDPRKEIREHLSPLEKAGQEVKSGFDRAMKPKPSDASKPAASDAHVAEPAKTAATNLPAAQKATTAKRKAASTARKATASKTAGGTREKKAVAKKAAPKKAGSNGAAKSAAAPKATAAASGKPPAGKSAAAAKSSTSRKSASRGKISGPAS